MQKIELFCDICGEPLSEEIPAKDMYGETCVINRHDVYTTLVKDTKKIFPHLCARCASKLDYMFKRMDELEIEKQEMVKHRHELNEKRKIKFNTRG